MIIFAEGKLDSKRRFSPNYLSVMPRSSIAVEVKRNKNLRQYFQKWSQKQGLQFTNHSFENLLIKSGFQFSEIQKNLLFFTVLLRRILLSRKKDIVNAIPRPCRDQYFDLTQFILTKKMDQARDW
ncbi:hypothetical protein AK85_16030 [Streptococcus pneumoniae B1598]|nr:hypothetical protein AK85_16030 [Streptococcus pneumoniae B1598]